MLLPYNELGQSCLVVEDCRQYAYTCDNQSRACDCSEGYRPDEPAKICVGAIGRRCNYDSHCIPNAYCKGQTICTCKREFGYPSLDKWSCQVSAAGAAAAGLFRSSMQLRMPAGLMAPLGAPTGAIIIPLVLVSSWQLKINLFTV
ncbi:uncharacterized protein LOC129762612 isoform X1 [Toxorhynchites rutilus septentrionalis]|uniref:uncharacterized protein LOC129762612 isoform X1 n=1 Tax=Toxorhynchites rutilus septentrionalis TaxID=329112 RepID=UPI0024788847|nr:uncharacterized protein LOC129762612 isoform X1 [Toxorhynchites rutilus septentrionalis]